MKRRISISSILMSLLLILLIPSCSNNTNISTSNNITSTTIQSSSADTSSTIPETTSNINTEEIISLDNIFESETTSLSQSELLEITTTTTESITTITTTQTTISNPNQITVYITDTGTKYHKSDCKYLKKSSTSISLQEAISQNYKPCSKCNPPELENTNP